MHPAYFTGRVLLIASVIIFGYSINGQTQQFLNGSFELTSIDSCGGNLPNLQFTSQMEYTTAYGPKNEVDILSEPCGYGAPNEGTFYIAINSQSMVDAISMELDEPLQEGKRYAFTFYERAGFQDPPYPNSGIEIGVSNNAESYGVPIYETKDVFPEWTAYLVEFIAPFDANYITARGNPRQQGWIHVDNFRFKCPESLKIGEDSILCEVSDILLQADANFDRYLWSDGSNLPSLQLSMPGTYWLEVQTDDCILRDTVRIEEFPGNCDCNIFVPNVITPNFDGINDVLRVFPECPFQEYELRIFNRWGSLLYASKNPNRTWDGVFEGKPLEVGTYVYRLKYRFDHMKVTQVQYGDVAIIK